MLLRYEQSPACDSLVLGAVENPEARLKRFRAAAAQAQNVGVSRKLSYVTGRSDCYLVDPASGHMLVSKIKPCMSKHSW